PGAVMEKVYVVFGFNPLKVNVPLANGRAVNPPGMAVTSAPEAFERPSSVTWPRTVTICACCVGVRVGVAVGAGDVGVRVGVAVGAADVGVRVGVAVGAGDVGVRVGVAVGAGDVGVRVGVAVDAGDVGVRVGVAVGAGDVGVRVGVAVAGGAPDALVDQIAKPFAWNGGGRPPSALKRKVTSCVPAGMGT